jgi:hypothetical protein
MVDRFFTSLASQRLGVLGLRILAGVGLTLFGVLQIVFPSPLAGIDLRFHRWMSRRVPALYAIPGMRHRLDERLQVRTTVLFGGLFVVVGISVAGRWLAVVLGGGRRGAEPAPHVEPAAEELEPYLVSVVGEREPCTLESGANPVMVAFRLGHTSTRMLEHHYAGRLDRADRELARALTLRHGCGTLSCRATTTRT